MQSKLKIGNFTREKSALVLKTKKKNRKKNFLKKHLNLLYILENSIC